MTKKNNVEVNLKLSEKYLNSMEMLIEYSEENVEEIDETIINEILKIMSLEDYNNFITLKNEAEKDKKLDDLYDLDWERQKIISKITKEILIYISKKNKEKIKVLLFLFDLVKNEINTNLNIEKKFQTVIKWEILFNEKKNNSFVRWWEIDKKYLDSMEWEFQDLKIQLLEHFKNFVDAINQVLRWSLFNKIIN